MSPKAVISHTVIMARNIHDIRLAAPGGDGVTWSAILVGWRSPSPGVLKLNTDAYLEQTSGRAYEGGLIRDDVGNWS